jgi:hypothetical protein
MAEMAAAMQRFDVLSEQDRVAVADAWQTFASTEVQE